MSSSFVVVGCLRIHRVDGRKEEGFTTAGEEGESKRRSVGWIPAVGVVECKGGWVECR
jgi:hypothetical protein